MQIENTLKEAKHFAQMEILACMPGTHLHEANWGRAVSEAKTHMKQNLFSKKRIFSKMQVGKNKPTINSLAAAVGSESVQIPH